MTVKLPPRFRSLTNPPYDRMSLVVLPLGVPTFVLSQYIIVAFWCLCKMMGISENFLPRPTYRQQHRIKQYLYCTMVSSSQSYFSNICTHRNLGAKCRHKMNSTPRLSLNLLSLVRFVSPLADHDFSVTSWLVRFRIR